MIDATLGVAYLQARFIQAKRGGVAMLHERETDLMKFSLERRDGWYVINAWGRTSKHAPWRAVWINRCHISYLAALNEFNDTGAALADWKSLLSFA